MGRIVFSPTFKCNFNCSYCYQRKLHFEVMPEMLVDFWLGFFNSIEPYDVDMVGGEVSQYYAFVDLFNGFPSKHRLYLTTNLSMPREVIEKLSDTKLRGGTISLHELEVTKDFLYKARLLQSKSSGKFVFNLCREVMDENSINEYRRIALNNGFLFNIEPWVSVERDFYILPVDNGQICRVGDYCHVMASGDVWRCLTSFCYFIKGNDLGIGYFLGNVVTDNWANMIKSNDMPCELFCAHGCDRYQQGTYQGRG